jgi:spermidine/putrescine transport system permease protein
VELFVFLPLATPEVVLGAALLGLFLTMGVATGFGTILIAHVMFNVSYVVITIRARLAGMDTHIEEAAMDLGANEWTTFRLVTLPLILPGVAAAGLLVFALSFDDFVITNFNAGQTVTFPLFIWGAARQGVPPQVNVLATALLVIALVFMVVNLRRQSRAAAAHQQAVAVAQATPVPV